MRSHIATQRCATASHFLQRLTLDEDIWPPDPRLWVFRGQADACSPLVAAALRADCDLEFTSGRALRGPRKSFFEQVAAEYELLHRYVMRLDARGLAIPEDSQRHRSGEGVMQSLPDLHAVLEGEAPWPPLTLRSQMALAQHYGIPTRLLDWTRNPLFAAYFAARGAAARGMTDANEPSACSEYLAVWAFHVRYLHARAEADQRSRIELVTAPAASNPNLLAQAALFTLDGVRQKAGEPVRVEPLDEVLDAEARQLPSSFFDECSLPHVLMTQLTLPISEAPCLLRLLAYRGVDAAAVYPTHQGVAQAIRDEAMWDGKSAHFGIIENHARRALELAAHSPS